MFKKRVPKTVDNFLAFCSGEYRGKCYKNNEFHKVIPYFMMQGGDTIARDGTGKTSIYGDKFDDEGTFYPHSHRGLLSTANWG